MCSEKYIEISFVVILLVFRSLKLVLYIFLTLQELVNYFFSQRRGFVLKPQTILNIANSLFITAFISEGKLKASNFFFIPVIHKQLTSFASTDRGRRARTTRKYSQDVSFTRYFRSGSNGVHQLIIFDSLESKCLT